MTAIFAGTFYWVALTNIRDSAHEEAKTFSRSLTSASLVTTEPVLIEYLNYFAAWGQELRLMASASANSMLSSSTVIVLPLTSELFRAGVDLYAAGVATLERRSRRRDKDAADPVRCGIPNSDQSLPRDRWL